jgi:hyperosmotically inducible periplasmic protein
MKKTLLFSTIVIGLVLTGCNKTTKKSTAANDTTAGTYSSSTTAATDQTAASTTSPTATTTSTDTFGNKVDRAGRDMSNAASNAADSMRSAGQGLANTARTTEWRLNSSDIQADLDAKRDIIRTKDAAGTPTGHTDRKMIKSSVEGRFKADSDLSNLKLSVDAKRDGEVELDGKAMSADQVGKAIALALDTDGVNKVTSKIRLDSSARTTR